MIPTHSTPTRTNALPRVGLICLLAALTACGVAHEESVPDDVIILEEASTAAPPSAAKVSDEILPPSRPSKVRVRPRKGVVTAGDIDDGLNLASFFRYQAKTSRKLRLPSIKFGRPFAAQLVGPSGKPAPGVLITLRKPGAAAPFYTGHSGVDGAITVFPTTHGAGNLSKVELRAFAESQGGTHVQTIRLSGKREAIRLPFDSAWKPKFLDLMFVIDTTGSMGDELAWLTKELRGIVREASRSAPGVDIKYGLVAYRDNGDEYVVRNLGFTNRQSQAIRNLKAQTAAGGGDYPEAAAAALTRGVKQWGWRKGNGERLLFHIADAPPHKRDAAAYLRAAGVAADKGIQIFGLGASGVADESEFLMRQAALQTNGRYIFLTDDSGVGNAHAEPSVACYRVTKLRDLMIRTLRSELGGRRIEAKPGDVIRTVGSYQNGVCRN